METPQKPDSSDSRVSSDTPESETCKNGHKYQWVVVDTNGHHWQYCTGCDRKLFVRQGMKTMVKKELLLSVLLDAWTRQPHLRLGQLIYNTVAPKEQCPELFYIEDRELYKLLENNV